MEKGRLKNVPRNRARNSTGSAEDELVPGRQGRIPDLNCKSLLAGGRSSEEGKGWLSLEEFRRKETQSLEAGSPRRASVSAERCRQRRLIGENEGTDVPYKTPRIEATPGSYEVVVGRGSGQNHLQHLYLWVWIPQKIDTLPASFISHRSNFSSFFSWSLWFG